MNKKFKDKNAPNNDIHSLAQKICVVLFSIPYYFLIIITEGMTCLQLNYCLAVVL